MNKKLIKTSIIATVTLFLLLSTSHSNAYSVAERAHDRRVEIIHYIRYIQPMVYNFPCEPFPECLAELKKKNKVQDAERIKSFKDVKRVYQEGLIYFYEGRYLKAYMRFLDSQSKTEKILEKLSLSYLNRAQYMLRDSIEKKRLQDPSDMTVVDISIQYGPNSRKRKDFKDTRESPHTQRRYNSKEVHWAQNKWHIEGNLKKGYEYLGHARRVRQKALLVDAILTKGAKSTPTMRQKRIRFYLASIKLARQAKVNAARIYQLKYPFDNYVLFNHFGLTEKKMFDKVETPAIENTKMNWAQNPYVYPVALHTVFDLRVPAKYRRDTTDSRGMIYDDEVDINIFLKYYTEESRKKIENLNYQPASNNNTPKPTN